MTPGCAVTSSLFQTLHPVPCLLESSQQLQAGGTSIVPILQMGELRLQDINLPKELLS